VKEKIPSLTGIRAIAALVVVFYHYGSETINVRCARLSPGTYAVNIFFVLSGFLITRLLLDEVSLTGTISLKNFYIRRSRRIFPAFYGFLAVRTLVAPPMPFWPLAAVATYWGNYYSAFHGWTSLADLGHTWSLAAEEQFYLLWPLVFLLFHRNRRNLVWIVVAAIAMAQIGRLFLPLVYVGRALEMRWDGVLLGSLLAILQPKLPKWALHPELALGLIAINVGTATLTEWSTQYGLTISTWTGALLILQAVEARWWILNNPVAEYLGNISYSLYLYHLMVITLVKSVSPYSWGVNLFLSVVLSITAAALSSRFIEKPFLRAGGTAFRLARPAEASVT
jgi:peptidoglycan/LPS O-acetylase OafA/YrhL